MHAAVPPVAASGVGPCVLRQFASDDEAAKGRGAPPPGQRAGATNAVVDPSVDGALEDAAAAGRRARRAATALDALNVVSGDAGRTVCNGWDRFGFNVNGVFMRGSVLLLPTLALLWDVTSVEDITVASLMPAMAVRPRVDLLFIGTGEHTVPADPVLSATLARRGIAVEAVATKHAVATFNVLNEEGRNVAAALVSRDPMPIEETYLYR